MTDKEPSGQQIYDPILGKNRDAFPGEVVASDQQPTLLRLMAEERKKYQDLYDKVAGTGKLDETELNALLRAGDIASELRRTEFLEAIRTNPANIIQNILKEFDSNLVTRSLLENLDQNIDRVKEIVKNERNKDLALGKTPRDTQTYLKPFIGIGNESGVLTRTLLPDQSAAEVGTIRTLFSILKGLDALPSPDIENVRDLLNSIPRANTSNLLELRESKKPYSYFRQNQNNNEIGNLTANKPGLEGVTVLPILNRPERITDFYILGTSEVFSRVIDRGGYTPYTQSRQSR